MNRPTRLITILLAMHALCASAQWHAVFTQGRGWSAALVDAIDSIKVTQPPMFDVYFDASQEAGGAAFEPHGPRMVSIRTDTLFFSKAVPDTLSIRYEGDAVTIRNPRLDCIRTKADGACVTVTATGRQPFVCEVAGSSADGRLVIDSDTTFTLVLSDLDLTSQKASAVSLPRKQKARIVLTEGTTNTLSDAATYQTDSTDTSNGCLYAKGSITFAGNGTLSVSGNSRHAISSGKNITIEDGHIIIHSAEKDGLHCDQLQMEGGRIVLRMATDASKGIKCKESFTMTGGSIVGEATGNVTIEDGETTYCTLLKSNGTFTMTGGEMTLAHQGLGGRCISVDGNMTIAGGTMNLECHGDGGSYITASNDQDYFTPKCITVDGTACIERGQLYMLATGDGGKGIACSDTLMIGRNGDGFLPEDSLLMTVETRGTALEDNVSEDYRRGCPKAIKSGGDIYAYSGTMRIKTSGQGGEGVESKGSLRTYNTTIIADCYDDGINTGLRFVCKGSHIYARSKNNDGIDSNGKLSIHDGIVASISEDQQNESFDTENGKMYIYGGHVIGIGHGSTAVGEASIPYYTTQFNIDTHNFHTGENVCLNSDKWITLTRNGAALISLWHENEFDDFFLTVASSLMVPGEIYEVVDSTKPERPTETWLDGQLVLGGTIKEGNNILLTIKTD